MKDIVKNIQEKIDGGNPWYVDEQLPNLDNPVQIRVIKKRWGFFNKIIGLKRAEVNGRKLKFLDAGCGDGINLSFIANMPDVSLFACDYNPLRVERARKQFPQINITWQDLTNIQWDERDFDIILCSQVLEHIPNDEAALKQLRRILAPEGVLILGVPNEGCLLGRLRNHVIQPIIGKTTDHVNAYTIEHIMARFKAAGFKVIDKMNEGFFIPHTRIHDMIVKRDLGFMFMDLLGRIISSQTGGYYFVLRKFGETI